MRCPACRIWFMFPLRATGSRQLLPHVNGFPVLGVLWVDPTPQGSSASLSFSVQVAYLSSLGLTRLGAGLSLWVRVSPSVPSQPHAMPVSPRAQESMGSPKFFDAPLHACHVLMTPAGLWNLTNTIPLRGLTRKRKRWPPASLTVLSGLYQTSGRCGLPYGLHGSLCTLQTFRSVRLSTLLLRICNTRYGRLVRPYPAGTCTLQEAPSLSWRTRYADERREPRCLRFPSARSGGLAASFTPV
jgi:hypothetical protein